MRVGILGINHKLASVRLRELLARACQRRFSPQLALHSETHAFVLLSTCNRTEVYFWGHDLAETHAYILAILRREVNEQFEHKLYSYFSADCFWHLARVTAGLDSAVLGETEIQGQVKLAYEAARADVTLPADLHFLFQKSLGIGKKVRSQLTLGEGVADMESAVVRRCRNFIGNLEGSRVLFVGASDTNVRVLQRFRSAGATDLALCNRTEVRGQRLATSLDVQAQPWSILADWHAYDVVVFGTKAPHPLIKQADLPCGGAQTVLVDLSVPRNVDPALARHCRLINIDQIDALVAQRRRVDCRLLASAVALVKGGVEQQLAIFNRKQAYTQVA